MPKSKVVDGKKICKLCNLNLPVYNYGMFTEKRGKTGPMKYYNSVCKKCAAKRTKTWCFDNPDKVREVYDRTNNKRKADRDVIYKAYGNKCSCCGESNPLFLSIDHVNNDGYKIRPRNRNGNRSGTFSGHYYAQIIKAGFPKDLQLLCYNCNCGKARNGGVCPHKNK